MPPSFSQHRDRAHSQARPRNAAQRAAEDDVMKPKLKVVIRTKTSFCEVDLVPNRANTAFLWVIAGGIGDEDTAEKLKALKQSVARWAATVPRDVAEDLFGDAK